MQVMGKQGSKIKDSLAKFYAKYENAISLNKILVVSGTVGFAISIVASYAYALFSTNNFNNSALTVIIGYTTSKTIFAILFHIDNKKTYTKKLSGKINFYKLKQLVKKMVFANSIFDIINNFTRFIVLYQLLGTEFPPVQAATVSSIAASSLSYLAINLIVKRINVFGSKKKKVF
jgi:hypothetical protein